MTKVRATMMSISIKSLKKPTYPMQDRKRINSSIEIDGKYRQPSSQQKMRERSRRLLLQPLLPLLPITRLRIISQCWK